MKILFCTNKFQEVSNGPAKFANFLLKINEIYHEHEIRILTEDVSVCSPYIYTVNINYPKIFSLASQFLRIVLYHRAALKIQNSYDFDVIVYNNAFIGMLSARFFPLTVGMINDDNNLTRNLANFSFNKKSIKEFIFKQFERKSTKFYNVILVNSNYLRNRLIEEYNVPISKIKLLYKGVELSVSSGRISKVSTDKLIRVLFVKSDFERGGLQDLIQALGHVNFRFKLTIIGPGVDNFHLINYWASFHENLTIDLKGIQSQDVVKNLLAISDLFCVPSHKEALGVANLEALAMAVPVVSTNVGGIPEVLDYGNCGWLVPPKNPEALAGAITECLSDHILRQAKIQNGLEHVQKFDILNTLHNFVEAISL